MKFANDNNAEYGFFQFAPRGMSKSEAAKYCGCATTSAFDTWIQRGIVPGPIPGTSKWDRKAIDVALDKASGLDAAGASSNLLADWKAKKAARIR